MAPPFIIRAGTSTGGGGAPPAPAPSFDFTTSLTNRYLLTSDAALSNEVGEDSLQVIDLSGGTGVVGVTGDPVTPRQYSSEDGILTTTLENYGDGEYLQFQAAAIPTLTDNGGTVSIWVTFKQDITSRAGGNNQFFMPDIGDGSIGLTDSGYGFYAEDITIKSSNNYPNGDTDEYLKHGVWPIPAGRYHVAFVNGASRRALYVNGELADEWIDPNDQVIPTGYWPRRNRNWYVGYAFFKGWLKDLSIWTGRTLTSEEIAGLYANGAGGNF